MRCTVCTREYPEPLPYCSEAHAALDREYVADTDWHPGALRAYKEAGLKIGGWTVK